MKMEPVEVERQQPWFLNCAVKLETELLPGQLLSRVLALEQAMGRLRTEKKGPRTIDIDIVLFGDEVAQTPELTVPHPAMQHRRFVLEPLAEIAPEARHPGLKRTARELRPPCLRMPAGRDYFQPRIHANKPQIRILRPQPPWA